ncbi:ligand-gated ion channel [Facilibium subflavum]|uniref:hypothetical protein n=1 Tax=Facilibium subflavum TaxID=2219058 RepID=UPI000E654204|nr:hypothetical protein [Facilibium subflavum]
MKNTLITAILLLIATFGIQTKAVASQKSAEKVVVGAYISHIYNINLQKKTVSVIFWLWFIYPNEEFNNNVIDIINAENSVIMYQNKEQLSNGSTLKQYKIRATLYQDWDFKDFPFSTQNIALIIEDSDYPADNLQFTADNTHSGIDHTIPVSGWLIGLHFWQINNYHYATSFGQPERHGTSEYSRATFSVQISHNNIRTFIHIFGMLYLACFLVLCMFFVPIPDIKSRLALNSAAIFAVVGSKISTDAILPPASTIGLVDKIQLSTLLFMIITLIVMLLNYYLHTKNKRLAHTVNVIFAIITTTFIITANLFFIYS